MSAFDRSIISGVQKGIKAALPKAVPGIVDTVLNSLFEHPAYAFTAGAQLRFVKHGMKPREAWELARSTIAQFLADEKIAFGAPGYDWSAEAGADLMVEMEIDHWERSS